MRVSSESLWWRDLKSINHHPQLGQQLNKSISWKVGCRDKFKFWEDNWTGGENSLAVVFPRLYTISVQQQHLIQQVGAFNEEGWEWNFQWRRPLFDSEIQMAVDFLQEVEGIRLRSEEHDRWLWVAEPNGRYSAKSAYKVIREDILGDGQVRSFKELWKLRVPAKVTMFAWRLIQDKLSIRDNLKKKRIELQEYLCPFCILVDESASHLFLHCSNISPLWWESLSWLNLVGVFPYHLSQHFIQHIHGGFEGLQTTRWQWWWLALTYTIWKHRNNIIFSNATFNAHKLMDDAVFLLWTWLRCLEKNFTLHFNHWSSNIKSGFSRTGIYETTLLVLNLGQ